MKTKKCNTCKEIKPIEEFGKKSAAKDGKNPKCKECVCEYQNERNKRPDVHAYNVNKSHKRRAFKNELPNDMTAKEWNQVKAIFDNRCFLTGKLLDKTNRSMEHVIPLCTGHGGHIVENVLPMDRSLNMGRKDKNILEWFNEFDATLEMHRRLDEAVEYLAELNGLTVDEYWQYVYYCDEFRRTIEEVEADKRPSVEIFQEWKAEGGRI